MKKLLATIIIAASLAACNDSSTKTETATDSTTHVDSSLDTTHNLGEKAKELVDSATNKVEKAADLAKDTSGKK